MISEQQLADLKAGKGELRFTVTVVRKETGLTETYDMIGKLAEDEKPEPKVHAVAGAISGEGPTINLQ